MDSLIPVIEICNADNVHSGQLFEDSWRTHSDEQVFASGMYGDSGIYQCVYMPPDICRLHYRDAGSIRIMGALDNFLMGNFNMFDQMRFNFGDMPEASASRIAIVGLPGAGKKTLCNSLLGWDAVRANGETARNFGLLTLVDLPLDPYDAAGVLYRLESTDFIVYVLDGEQGLEPDSFNWIARLRGLNVAMLIVLNKSDRIPSQKLQSVLEYLETRTARPVIPLNAVHVQCVRDNLLRAILQICPDLAIPLATEITSLRQSVALHIVVQAMMASLTINLEDSARHDSSVLVGLHLRLIREIAAIYGYKEQSGTRQRMSLSIVLRWLVHLVIKQTARIQKLEGRYGGNAISMLSTLIVGRGAMLVYGGQLPRWLMRYTPQAWRTSHVPTDIHGKS